MPFDEKDDMDATVEVITGLIKTRTDAQKILGSKFGEYSLHRQISRVFSYYPVFNQYHFLVTFSFLVWTYVLEPCMRVRLIIC